VKEVDASLREELYMCVTRAAETCKIIHSKKRKRKMMARALSKLHSH